MINCILMHILYDWKGRLHSVTLLDLTDIILYRVSIDTKKHNNDYLCYHFSLLFFIICVK